MRKRIKQRKKVAPIVTQRSPADEGTPEFQRQCGDALITLKGAGSRRRNVVQIPLDYYRFAVKQKEPVTGKLIPTLTARQHMAGSELHRHFHMSGLIPSSAPISEMSGIGSGGGDRNPSERQEHHRKMFRRAVEAIKGTTGKVLALNVCCYGFLLKDISIPYYHTPTVLMPPLKEALDELADFFQISHDYIDGWV